MSLQDAERVLRGVDAALSRAPRNAYEAQNTLRGSAERLSEVRTLLQPYSGDRVAQLHARLAALEARVQAARGDGDAAQRRRPQQQQPCASHVRHDAFAASLDELDAVAARAVAGDDNDNNNDDDEMAQLRRAQQRSSETAAARRKARKQLHATADDVTADEQTSGGKKSTKKKATKATTTTSAHDDAAVPPPQRSSSSPAADEAVAHGTRATVTPSAPQQGDGDDAADGERQLLLRCDGCAFDAIPAVCATSSATCTPIRDSALVRLDCDARVPVPVRHGNTNDGSTNDDDGCCNCRIEVYRCVLLTCMHAATHVTDDFASATAASVVAAAASAAQTSDDDDDSDDDDSDDAQQERSDVAQGQQQQQLSELSEQLVAEYDAAQQEREADALPAHTPPRRVDAAAVAALRACAQTAVWVVLLCHGGYFAGGVFARGVCVAHKSFQRYVVRKKQGGKQSSYGDGGSFHSIGSQIRAAQEAKWRAEVRALLQHTWRAHLDAATLILYAAPGPQNRSMLMDSATSSSPSATSATTSGDAAATRPPLTVKDARVWRVPLTTHRPTFAEVQRVYATVARVNVVYYRPRVVVVNGA